MFWIVRICPYICYVECRAYKLYFDRQTTIDQRIDRTDLKGRYWIDGIERQKVKWCGVA